MLFQNINYLKTKRCEWALMQKCFAYVWFFCLLFYYTQKTYLAKIPEKLCYTPVHHISITHNARTDNRRFCVMRYIEFTRNSVSQQLTRFSIKNSLPRYSPAPEHPIEIFGHLFSTNRREIYELKYFKSHFGRCLDNRKWLMRWCADFCSCANIKLKI